MKYKTICFRSDDDNNYVSKTDMNYHNKEILNLHLRYCFFPAFSRQQESYDAKVEYLQQQVEALKLLRKRTTEGESSQQCSSGSSETAEKTHHRR